jgi:hypothetical protein
MGLAFLNTNEGTQKEVTHPVLPPDLSKVSKKIKYWSREYPQRTYYTLVFIYLIIKYLVNALYVPVTIL